MESSSELTKTFENFLAQQNLEKSKLLLMVSGGVDSMVLLHVACQVVKPELIAVLHVNHQAREEAEADEYFVQNFCSKKGVQCFTEKLDPTSSVSNQEAQWRTLRQNLAQKAVQQFRAERILTAHHATDLVETMLHRIVKGAGPSGLSPFDTSTKPFWQVPKQAIIEYALAHQLEWREDESNLNTKFERNLIRTEIIPVLRSITPNLEKVFVRESQTFAQLQDFLDQQLYTQCGEALKSQTISLEAFQALHPTMQAELLRHIAQKTPSQRELEDCLKWLLENPKGTSTKTIGSTKLEVELKQLKWEL